ncbi:Hypothetical protein AAM4_1456 [Actinomyces succiniciruminis]|uniref:Uncharacterized protein n=3 Tax=Actinomyces TaxID=1654 RepID=A0A1L7RP57_9ACTO|nr:Hypothetical protein AAM4_1456 [Actinomyces succiniciruminis]
MARFRNAVWAAVPAGTGYDPAISPNWTFLPFMDVLTDLVGSTVAVGIVCLVAVAAIGGLVWAGGNFWDHGRATQIGKGAVAVSIIAAFVVGGASALIRWGAQAGSGI